MERVPAAFAPVAYIPGLFYEALVRMRGSLYSRGIIRRQRLPGPVISIGNLTMGGTGKTPLVIYTARTLAKLGFEPAVLTRGYGRDEPNRMHIVSPGEYIHSPAAVLGDEPAVIRRHLPAILLGISKNRYLAGKEIWKRHPGVVFVLDDGFQHLKLQRDLDIVLVDRSRPPASDRLIPLGTLREPLAGLCRCDVVIVNDMPHFKKADAVATQIRELHPGGIVFQSRQEIASLVPIDSWKKGEPAKTPQPAVRTAYLVSAVGNPERFRRDIERTGIRVTGATSFADHHRIGPKEWQGCIVEAMNKNAEVMIMTEKDAVKIDNPPAFPLLVAVQDTVISDPGKFEQILRESIEARL